MKKTSLARPSSKKTDHVLHVNIILAGVVLHEETDGRIS